MIVSGELAVRIADKWARFSPGWKRLAEENRQIAIKVLIMCEMVGGRAKAAGVLGVSDNTIDNYRRGSREPKHLALAALTEHAGLPPSALNYRWLLEGERLLFEDLDGNVLTHPSPSATIFDDPPGPYSPGFDELASVSGFAEADHSPVAALYPWYRDDLHLDPKHVTILIARGGSMSPAIADGAPVFINTADRDLTDGGVYVFGAPGENMIRRVRRLARGSVELIADNQETNPPQRIKKSSLAGLQVVGRVRYPPTD